MNRALTSRKLGLEQFESRQLLAGNVMVSVSSGDLFLTGDAAANGVQISQARDSQGNPIPGSYLISGQAAGNAATTINGHQGAIVSGITHDVQINLGAGDDLLTTGQSPGRNLFAGDLNVNLGEG